MTEPLGELGARLRSIRRQQHLTLHDVEERSGGEWKAVVVGSYERGDRAISITKLARLAAFYRVPMHDLLPHEEPTPSATDDELVPPRIDLRGLARDTDDAAVEAVSRYVRRIQVERGDYNGRVLTIRQSDLHAIALAFGVEPTDLVERLEDRRALVR